MSVDTFIPETVYLGRTNIVFPGTVAQALAAEATARVEIAARKGLATTSGGTIRR
jgi:hypothetical protein